MRIDNLNIKKEELREKTIAFPTDTVYGVGALIEDEKAIEKIYKLKKRDLSKPLAILAGNIEDILKYVETPSKEVMNLMNKYWPGALTIVFKKKKNMINEVTRGLETVGFRIPNDIDALDLLKRVGPLATTSVNISGNEPLNNGFEIEKEFGDLIDFIYIKDVQSSSISSTVVDCSNNEIKILRQGEIIIK